MCSPAFEIACLQPKDLRGGSQECFPQHDLLVPDHRCKDVKLCKDVKRSNLKVRDEIRKLIKCGQWSISARNVDGQWSVYEAGASIHYSGQHKHPICVLPEVNRR